MTRLLQLLLLALLLALPVARADDSPRQKLEKFLADLQTLTARFDQQVIDTEANQVSRASGVLYVSRPGRFRWEYQGEYPRYILADGRTIWLVESDLEQVSQRSQKAALEGTPAGLLAERGELERDFSIEGLGSRQGVSWLRLVPRNPESQFEQILIGFEGEQLASLEMADHYGQVTRFRFYDLKKNVPLPEELFRFEPPPGYDILDQ
jgi:outer membrane lipoprotein carrier protein